MSSSSTAVDLCDGKLETVEGWVFQLRSENGMQMVDVLHAGDERTFEVEVVPNGYGIVEHDALLSKVTLLGHKMIRVHQPYGVIAAATKGVFPLNHLVVFEGWHVLLHRVEGEYRFVVTKGRRSERGREYWFFVRQHDSGADKSQWKLFNDQGDAVSDVVVFGEWRAVHVKEPEKLLMCVGHSVAVPVS